MSGANISQRDTCGCAASLILGPDRIVIAIPESLLQVLPLKVVERMGHWSSDAPAVRLWRHAMALHLTS